MATQRIFYKVLYDFQAEEEGEMSVTQGTFVQTAGACSSYPVRRVQRQPDTHKCLAGSPFISTGDAPGDPHSPFRDSYPPVPPRVLSARLGVTPTLNHSPLTHNNKQTCVPYHSPPYPPSPPLAHVPLHISLS